MHFVHCCSNSEKTSEATEARTLKWCRTRAFWESRFGLWKGDSEAFIIGHHLCALSPSIFANAGEASPYSNPSAYSSLHQMLKSLDFRLKIVSRKSRLNSFAEEEEKLFSFSSRLERKNFLVKEEKKEILGWDFRAFKVRDLVDRSDCEESKCRKLLEQNTLSLSSRSRSPTKQKVFRQRAEARKKLCELKLLVSFPIFFGEERESEQKRETMQQEKADYRGETFAFREKKCASLDCIRNERSAPLAA